LDRTANTAQELSIVNKICELLVAMPVFPAALLRAEEIESTVSKIKVMVEHGVLRDELRKKVLALFTADVLTFGAVGALAELQKVNQQWFLAKFLGQNRIRKRMHQLLQPGKSFIKTEMESMLKNIIQLQEEEKAVRDAEAFAAPLLSSMWNGGNADWAQVSEASDWLLQLDKLIAMFCKDGSEMLEMRNRFSEILAIGRDYFLEKNAMALQRFIDLKLQIDRNEDALSQLLVLDLPRLKEKSGSEIWFAFMGKKLEGWEMSLENLRDWCTWMRVRSKAIEAGLMAVIQPYEAGKLQSSEVVAAFERGIYKTGAELIIAQDERLNSFSSKLFEETIKKFTDANNRFEALTQKEIFARLAAKVPQIVQSAAQSSESGILQRAIRSNGRGVSIRKLFEQIPNLLNRLCPCMLMSPISVAQYLDAYK
jgi:hypothetical protein